MCFILVIWLQKPATSMHELVLKFVLAQAITKLVINIAQSVQLIEPDQNIFN